MPSYTEITNGQVDQDSPISQALMTAIRDNPLALFEAATDSPVNQWAWHLYDMFEVGDGNDGVIWDHSSDGTSATIETPTFSAGFEYKLYLENLSSGGNSATFSVDFYKTSDAGYQGAGDMISGTFNAADVISGDIEMIAPMRTKTAHAAKFAINGHAGSLGIYDGTAQTISKIRLASDQSFDAGLVYLLKRKDPVSL